MIRIIEILVCITYFFYSLWVQLRLSKNIIYNRKQKTLQSFIIWLLPFIGGALINWLMSYNKLTGSAENKEASWKRLIKYDEHGEA